MASERIRLFICHSSNDVELVSRLVELVRAALNLPNHEVRCTSIDGHRLPGGANTDEQLRIEVHEADAFIGVVSVGSLRSLYVLFELGARWGARKHLIPLLTPGTSPSILGGPLVGLNALRADMPGQVHQLVSDLARVLGISPAPPESYQRYIEAVSQTPPGNMVEERSDLADVDPLVHSTLRFRRPLSPAERAAVENLPDESWELLQEAGRDRHGFVLMSQHTGGMFVQTNNRNFVEEGNPRSEAKWRGVVRDLEERGLLEQEGYKGEIFRVTDLGYQLLDAEEGSRSAV